jgi:serine/threonine protein kinase
MAPSGGAQRARARRAKGVFWRVPRDIASECLEEDVLAAWLGGRLGALQLAGVEAHVAGCSACLRRIGEQGTSRQASSAELELGSPALRPPGVGSAALVPSAAPQEIELDAERFELLELVAEGGMGEVYCGLDHQTGQRVAIKRLKAGTGPVHAELLARFTREAEILRRLDHPNIVKMLAVMEGAEQHSIVMEYVAGGSLRRELRQRPVLAPVEALLLTLEIADALSGAHRLRVIHRDVKPENVLIALDGSVKLADFGLARIGDRSFTAPGTVLGTVAYLSPEVLGGQEVDARTDLWSLGIVLFEMLSGVRPFVAPTPGATLSAILEQPVPSLQSVCPSAPARLVALTARLLQKDRERRSASAEEVVREVEAILEELVAAG